MIPTNEELREQIRVAQKELAKRSDRERIEFHDEYDRLEARHVRLRRECDELAVTAEGLLVAVTWMYGPKVMVGLRQLPLRLRDLAEVLSRIGDFE